MPEAARPVLTEFFGLTVGSVGAGKDCARASVTFNPHDVGEIELELLSLNQKLGKQFYPLGEIDGGHAILLIDELGWIYIWFDELPELIAKEFHAALERLLYGRRSRDS